MYRPFVIAVDDLVVNHDDRYATTTEFFEAVVTSSRLFDVELGIDDAFLFKQFTRGSTITAPFSGIQCHLRLHAGCDGDLSTLTGPQRFTEEYSQTQQRQRRAPFQ